MNARQKAHAELQHALDALTDGCGDDRLWGPGVVGASLWSREKSAGHAFDCAAQLSLDIGMTVAPITPKEQERFIANMRRLAPVILDIRLDALGVE